MESEQQVSGAIFAKKNSQTKEGEEYIIRSKNGAGWGLPVRDINPEDLRALADRIQQKRCQNELVKAGLLK